MEPRTLAPEQARGFNVDKRADCGGSVKREMNYLGFQAVPVARFLVLR